MPDETLLLLAKEVRNKTLRLLEGVTQEQSLWTPPGLNNHILWHAGHSFIVVQALAVGPLSGQPPVYPEGWFESFSWKSLPAAVKSWPPLESVVAALRQQLDTVLKGIEPLSADQLGKNIGDAAKPRTLRYSILHGFHDEAGHQGELYTLKKLIAKGKS